MPPWRAVVLWSLEGFGHHTDTGPRTTAKATEVIALQNLLERITHPEMAEKALTSVTQEAYVQSVSTRSLDDIVQAMGTSDISRAPSP